MTPLRIDLVFRLKHPVGIAIATEEFYVEWKVKRFSTELRPKLAVHAKSTERVSSPAPPLSQRPLRLRLLLPHTSKVSIPHDLDPLLSQTPERKFAAEQLQLVDGPEHSRVLGQVAEAEREQFGLSLGQDVYVHRHVNDSTMAMFAMQVYAYYILSQKHVSHCRPDISYRTIVVRKETAND